MSSKHRLRLGLLALAMGVASLFGGDPALANSIAPYCDGCDNKFYPGAVCKQAGSSQGLDYWFGRARNRASSAGTADGPLVRDTSRPHLVEIKTVDRHWWDGVSCSLYTLLNDSAWPSYYFARGHLNGPSGSTTTKGQSEVVQRLMIFPSVPSGPDTSYLVGCRLPPMVGSSASEIVSIRMGER